MAVPNEVPEIKFRMTEEEYTAWYNAALAAVNDEFLFIDVNDGVMNYLCLHRLVYLHPELEEKATEICNEVVRAGMGELGMFLGAANMANLLGLPPKEAEEAMMYPYTQEKV